MHAVEKSQIRLQRSPNRQPSRCTIFFPGTMRMNGSVTEKGPLCIGAIIEYAQMTAAVVSHPPS